MTVQYAAVWTAGNFTNGYKGSKEVEPVLFMRFLSVHRLRNVEVKKSIGQCIRYNRRTSIDKTTF